MAELVLVCPTRTIAKRLIDMDYTKQLMRLIVPIDVLLGEFDPPLCTNAGQLIMLAKLCASGAEETRTSRRCAAAPQGAVPRVLAGLPARR